MEEYVNENTIVKNEMYNAFKDSIICHICSRIMIEPVICLSCQDTFCKNCYKKNGSCQKCNNSNIQDVIDKNRHITKFKFKCIKKCGAEIPFDEINSHYNSGCEKKIKTLSPQEAANYRKEKKEDIPQLSSN